MESMTERDSSNLTNPNEALLKAWDRSLPAFTHDMARFGTQESTTRLKEVLDAFRRKLARGDQDYSFNSLKGECHAIINAHVPLFKRPPMAETLTTFGRIFLTVLAVIMAINLINFLMIKITALLGLITLVSLNFKVALAYSAATGTILAGLSAYSMFKPKDNLNNSLEKFSRAAQNERQVINIGGMRIKM